MDDYLNLFREMISLRSLTEHTAKSYSTYIKTYLFYLSKILHKTPEEVSWSDLREFVRWLQREKSLSDRTINHCISQLRFFTLYVLHKPWDPTQLPMRKFDSYLPLYLNYIRKINCYHVFCTFSQLFRLYFYLTIFSPQHPRQIHLLLRTQNHIPEAGGVLAEHDEGHKDCQEAGLRAVFQEGREDEGCRNQDGSQGQITREEHSRETDQAGKEAAHGPDEDQGCCVAGHAFSAVKPVPEGIVMAQDAAKAGVGCSESPELRSTDIAAEQAGQERFAHIACQHAEGAAHAALLCQICHARIACTDLKSTFADSFLRHQFRCQEAAAEIAR